MKYNPQIHHRRSIRLKGYDYSQAGAYFITICTHNRECRFGRIVVEASLADAQNAERATEMVAPTMELNEYGQIAYDEWRKLSERFINFELDVFQIMPNHMHGIIVLNDVVGATVAVTQNENDTVAQNDIDNPKVQTLNISPEKQLQPDQNEQPQKGEPPIGEEQKGEPQKGELQKGEPQKGEPQKGEPQGIAPTGNATVGEIVGAYKSLVANGCLDIYKTKNIRMGKLWQRNYYERIIRNEQSYQTISEYIINNPAKWKGDKFFIE